MDISGEVGQNNSNSIVIRRDGYSIRTKNRMAALHLRTPFQQFLYHLGNNTNALIFKALNKDGHGPMVHVLWSWALTK